MTWFENAESEFTETKVKPRVRPDQTGMASVILTT